MFSKGEMVRSSGTDVSLDGMLAILNELYNNVKALDALNQELFQLWMGEKEMVSEWVVHLSRHLQILAASVPECFPPDHIAKLKHDHFYGRLHKWLKAMVAHLKATANEKTYPDYLQVAHEVKKEEAIETPQSFTAITTNKLKATSLFSLWKLKGSKPIVTPSAWMAHMEEETAGEDGDDNDYHDDEVEDPDVIKVPWMSSSCTWPEPLKKCNRQKNAATTVTVQIILYDTAQSWQVWKWVCL